MCKILWAQVFAAASGCWLLVTPASAQDDFVASLRLRGGYDTNPLFATGQGIGGSAFIAADTALAAGGKYDGISLAVAAEGSATHYANREMPPAATGKVVLRGSIGDDAFRVSATTTLADTNSYNLRSSDLSQSLKLESRQGDIKLFATAEGGLARLNQTNAIFPDFFPAPHQFWRGTIIPGVSVVRGKAEFGASLNLSARRYREAFDIFGYQRNNERIEPFIFAKYTSDDLTAFASVSQLAGRWRDPDFSDVHRTLFDVSVSWKPKPFTLDLTASRRAGETTFPISPITIDTLYAAKAAWQIDDKWQVSASLGYADTEYVETDFRARTFSYGVGVVRDLGHDFKAGLDLTRMHGALISGESADAVIVAASLTKRFSPTANGKSAEGKDRESTTVIK